MDEAPLQTRVLSLARGVAGAYAVRLLADLGAECSLWLSSRPRPGDWPDDPLFHRYFREGVEVVDTNATLDEALGRLEGLAGDFDLIVTDFDAGELAQGELFRRLQPFNAAIVIANADHFGRTGPYAHWVGDELTDYAMGGYWAIAGDPGEPPLRVPGRQAQFHAGMHLALASLVALRHARITGDGQEVEVTGIEAMLGAHWSTTIAWTHEGRVLERTGSDLFRASDGWVFFFRLGQYTSIFLLVGRPELLEDQRWSNINGWLSNGPQLWSIVAEWCRDHTVDEIVTAAQELRIPVTPLNSADRLLADPDLAERGCFRSVGDARLPGMPYRWSVGWEPRQPPRRLAALLREGKKPVRTAPVTTTQRAGSALAGLRILELTNNWAGPIAGRHLGDLGAEVIKIELASKPATRASHYPGKEPGKYHWNRSGYFNEMNRNKRGLSLNLATQRGRALFLRLVEQADVVVENNSARVMPNLGLGYPQLARVNPRLVMASISGFGATGARRNWVAFGSNIETACGLAAVTGYPNGLPQRTGSFVADPIGGAHAAIAILAALERRDRTGKGAYIDIALIESAMPFMLQSFTHLQLTGEVMRRNGNHEPGDAPTGAYRCFGTDAWVAIAVRTDAQWQALAEVSGIDTTLGETKNRRLANRDSIDARLNTWTTGLDQYECTRMLQAVGVPAAPVLQNWQLHADPHLFARQAFVHIEHPDTGVLPYPGFPWRFSATPGTIRNAAPQFGEGNEFVFRSLLELSDVELAALYADGTTTDAPAGTAVPVRA